MTPFTICQLHIRMLSSSHSNMSVTYKTRKLTQLPLKICHPHIMLGNYLAPTQIHINAGLLDILDNSKILWSFITSRIPATRHQHSYGLQNLPVVPITTLLKTTLLRKCNFTNLIARKLPMDWSTATLS